jgi:cysteine desulfurase
VLGGGQEDGLRAGTENLAGVVGLGVAADLAARDGLAEGARLERLRDRLLTALGVGPGPGPAALRLLGPRMGRLPHHVSLVLAGVKSDSLLLGLDLAGISASAGSPCVTATGEPSHVLRAVGLSPREAGEVVLLTLGRWTTEDEVDAVAAALPPLVARLRALAGPA